MGAGEAELAYFGGGNQFSSLCHKGGLIIPSPNWSRGSNCLCAADPLGCADVADSNSRSVSSGVPLGSGLFNIFLSGLEENSKSSPLQPGGDLTAGGVVNNEQVGSLIQGTLDRLVTWMLAKYVL